MRMILALTLALCACATTRGSSCAPGAPCDVKGQLTLLPGQPAWAAILRAGPDCYKLALPEAFYDQVDNWNGKSVAVMGAGFDQYAQDGMLWFEYRGRKVSMGACDHGAAIYVTQISGPAGTLHWPGPGSGP